MLTPQINSLNAPTSSKIPYTVPDRYNIILAWFGGSQIHAYYNGKEINVVSVGGVPRDSEIIY